MQVDLGAIYDDTITVINKLDAKDAALKQDVYYPTVLEHCMWSTTSTRDVESGGTVVIGTIHQVQIPENDRFLPYREWREPDKRSGSFTLRTGDYIVLGEIDGEMDAQSLREMVKVYEPDAFQIKSFRDLTKGSGFDHSTDGVMRFAEVYYVEG